MSNHDLNNGSASGEPRQPSTPTPASVPPRIPDYELIRCVGKGAYGEVWLARNIMGAYRAVKIVYRASFHNDRPFEREFEGIRKFEPVSRTHESQLSILHMGRAEGCFYYVMELADQQGRGQDIEPDTYVPTTLRSELQFHGRLPFHQCLRIGLALTTALEHLHKNGLVHRDIKPSNAIFVNGIPKLADIGLVATADETMSFVGTEGYVPPEGPGSTQADIYSLGKVLYEIATGRNRCDFPELPSNLLELPDRDQIAELNEVIVRACQSDARTRYATAADMHADLALLQGGKSLAKMRALEGRLALAKKIVKIAAAAALVATVAFSLQIRQMKQIVRMGQAIERLEIDSRKRLADTSTALANSDFLQATRLIADGNTPDALAYLQRSLTLAPSNQAAITRLVTLLTYRKWMIPKLQLDCGSEMVSAIYTPDGKRIVSLSQNKTVNVWETRVWDAETGKPL